MVRYTLSVSISEPVAVVRLRAMPWRIREPPFPRYGELIDDDALLTRRYIDRRAAAFNRAFLS